MKLTLALNSLILQTSNIITLKFFKGLEPTKNF